MKIMKCLLLFVVLSLLPFTVLADWTLDAANSRINFVSVKKGKIGETHQFKTLSGEITAQGKAIISIDLDSVETHIAVRNERMKNLLFEVDLYPIAKVTTKLDMAQLLTIKEGERLIMPVHLIVSLHGKHKELKADMLVVGLQNNDIMVSDLRPIILNAFDFDLDIGIQKLLEIAKLPSIVSAIPVTFSLVFKAR